jgi:hypothetical protein
LVKLRNKLLHCTKDNLKICRTYTNDAELIYTNVNTPQSNYDWDRIWDNNNHILRPGLCADLIPISDGYIIDKKKINNYLNK